MRENETDLEACGWVVRIEDGPLSAEQQRQFDAWLATGPGHQGAYIRARAASLHFRRLGALAGGRSVFSAPTNVARRKLLAAAVSATSVLGVGAWLGRQWIADAWHGEQYVSHTGQVRRVTLADGSELLLNTATELFVRYGRNRREIHLTRGEALFTVALDMGRPFAVRVGEWIVLAARAAFVVQKRAATDITVTDGNVEVRSVGSSVPRQPQPLTTNQEAILGAHGVSEVRQVSVAEIGRRLAWRTGMVAFDGQPLHEAVAEMNRYSARQIVCDEPALCERSIMGVFPMTDTDTFVSMLQRQWGVEAVWEGTTTVRLRSRVN